MTDTQKQQLLDNMLWSAENKENGFPVIFDDGKIGFPIYDCKTGIRYGYDKYEDGEQPFKYRGLVLEVNDHGNVTVWNQFKNGNRREVASRV